MKMLNVTTNRVIGIAIGIFGICHVSIAGDITEYANKEWLRAGYVWGTTEIVGCQPNGPAGCAYIGPSIAADNPPWTFEVGPEGGTFTVVDGYLINEEQYVVYDNGALIGYTSEPTLVQDYCGAEPDVCLTTDASKGFFELEPGMHSITMEVIPGPFVAGVVFMRLDGDIVGAEIEVDIDIKPYNANNSISPGSSAQVAVAVLTSDTFDALQVDPDTVRFGPDGAPRVHDGKDHLKDIDNDGDMDLLLHFRISETGIQCGDTEATLRGETSDTSIIGTDSINTTGCRSGGNTYMYNGILSPNRK